MSWTAKEIKKVKESLEPMQLRYAEQYIIDFNGTKAAIRAGYAEPSAAQQSSRLLNNAKIQQYLQYLISDRSKRLQVTADKVVQEIAKIAFHNVQDLLDYLDGNVLFSDLEDMEFPEIIKSIEVKETLIDGVRVGQIAKIQVYDKVKALELLGKHTALFTENLNLTNNGESFEALPAVNIHINHRGVGASLEEPATDSLLD